MTMHERPAIDPVEAFLDAADEVLNSNTFLVEVPPASGDLIADVTDFIRSGRLLQALLAADKARGWYNLHRFTAGGELAPIPGSLAKADFSLVSRTSHCSTGEYLQAMLRGDSIFGNFTSFYRCEKSPEEARQLTQKLLEHLFARSEPSLHLFEADFLQGVSAGIDEACYFEGKGCDNAALLTGASVAYLLLTNGMP
ncbi:MAG TPA: hypothetical protein VFE32_00665 [Puia sp.]|jgi:hypothetical protein|nr:hypothetical protein [Puia sp.]